MNIKKILVGLSASALMLSFMVVPAFANVDRVPGPVEYGPWDVSGDWVFDYHYVGANLHDMTLVQDGVGVLTGTGGAFSGAPTYLYPWTITDGSVVDDYIVFTADYTDTVTCSFTATGTIATDGSMSGGWTDDCGPGGSARNGTWATTEGEAIRESTQFTGNHGQYVSSQENKQEAAQSRIGMPVQSKGHTK